MMNKLTIGLAGIAAAAWVVVFYEVAHFFVGL